MSKELIACYCAENKMDQPSEPHAVFYNDLLLDKIIGYAIQDKKKARTENIAACRLISRTWFQSVSRVLCKSREPLFRIFLEPDHFSIGSLSYCKRNEKPDELLSAAMRGHQQEDRVPPYSISASRSFRYNDEFLRCLTNCGSSLVQLKLPLLTNAKTVSGNDNIFLLPRLQCLEIEYFKSLFHDKINNNKDRRMDYVQRILDASVNLKSLLIYRRFTEEVPDCLAHLTFPASITQVDFNCGVNDCKLEMLAKNRMPNLRTLKFLVSKTPFQDELVGRILKNVRKTLKTLLVGESTLFTWQYNNCPTTFQLPVMEKLERIHIDTRYLALGEMFFSPMEKFAPALRHMVLSRQTKSMFRKWAENSCFHFVESLTVSLTTGDHHNNDWGLGTSRPLNFDLRTIETLKRAFPNLIELDITISPAEPIALVFIMKEMRNLRRLCIRTLASPHVTSSLVWDSLLIGVPEERMDELTKSPELWKEMQVLYSELPSIRNLNDLQTLELVGPSRKIFKYSLISRASFDFAFLQMPNLKFIYSRCCKDLDRWGNGGEPAKEYNLDKHRMGMLKIAD